MKRSLRQRWRERGSGIVRIVLAFDDIIQFSLALLALTPVELEALGWTFVDRKRLLDHLLACRKAMQGTKAENISKIPVELALPQCDADRLQQFERRELPKAVSNAGMIDRVLTALDETSHRSRLPWIDQRLRSDAAGRMASLTE